MKSRPGHKVAACSLCTLILPSSKFQSKINQTRRSLRESSWLWCGLFFLEIALHNDLNESRRIVVGVGIAHESYIATFGYASGNIDIEVIRHIGPRETLMPVRKSPMALRKRL